MEGTFFVSPMVLIRNEKLLVFCKTVLLLGMALLTMLAGSASLVWADDFDTKVAPVLANHCLECHSGKKPKGGLDLSRAKSAFEGGDSGKAVIPRNLSQSLLWEKIEADEMPPKHPLSKEDKSVLKNWIRIFC